MTTVAQDAPAWPGGVHPAADLFPMLDGDDLQALADDIAERGLLEPVWVLPDGRLLDGRNRYAACVVAGVDPDTRTYVGDDPVAFVVSLNIHRRHLTTGQKAMLALDVLAMYEAEAKVGRPSKPKPPDLFAPESSPEIPAERQEFPKHKRESTSKAATTVGTSGRAVGRAKRVAENAPDLAEKVKSGDLALDKAEKQLARRQAEKAEQEARKTVLAPVTVDAEGNRWRMLAGDFRERLAELPAGVVDLIVTDPPYPAEFLPLWSALAEQAARILRPQGVLVAMSGKIHLDEVMRRLGEHLEFGWVYVQPLPGSNSRIMARHILQAWKPWLAYSNGAWPSGRIDWHPDVLDPSARAKDRYRWEQDPDPAKMLIDALCPEGGMVLDPFAGTGAYGAAALSMGREFIGCEMDAQRFADAAERLRTNG